jgi:hypothetical protein
METDEEVAIQPLKLTCHFDGESLFVQQQQLLKTNADTVSSVFESTKASLFGLGVGHAVPPLS